MNEHPLIPDTQADKKLGLPEADTDVSVPSDELGLEWHSLSGLEIPDPHHVWMREYWDRFIRDDAHLRATIDYIHRNPVKAGLCREPSDWPWSSARSE